MSQEIKYLKESEVTQVLADGFAMLYHQRPKFPVTHLANYLKNHEKTKVQKKEMESKVKRNNDILEELEKKKKQAQQEIQKQKQDEQAYQNKEEQFINCLRSTQYHEDILNYFCDWIEDRYNLTGVYIGQLQNQSKEIDLNEQDAQDAHILTEVPKLIYFNHSSKSHLNIMSKKTLSQQSILGRLLSGQKAQGGEGQGEGQGNQEKKPKDQVYIPNVVDSKDVHFFKFPRLGAFYGLAFKIKSYLSEKIFDSNRTKIETFEKAEQEFETEQQEQENKFNQSLQEKAGSIEEQELQQMKKEFYEKQAQVSKPKLEDFQFIERSFVIGFDTLGKDKGISTEQQEKLRFFVNYLKSQWEGHELDYLKNDIKTNMGMMDKLEGSLQQAFTKLVQQQDRDLPSHEEVQKNKDNEQWMELQMETQRLQKIKQYLSDQRYTPFIDEIIDAKVVKNQQIFKYWLIFCGKSKQMINYPGTNILDLRKAKSLLDKNSFLDTINTYSVRGSRPDVIVKPYAKWQRLLKCLQKFDQNTIASYNVGLAFILRFLQLTGKVRLADRTKRLDIMTTERRNRKRTIEQNQEKLKQKEQKKQAAKEQAEEKEQEFPEQEWENKYNEENPIKEQGPEIPDQIDNDLDMPYVPPVQENNPSQ